MKNYTKTIALLLLTITLLSQSIYTASRQEEEIPDHHLTDEQMEALDRDAAEQAKHETHHEEKLPPIPYAEFIHFVYENGHLSKED